MNGHIYLQQSPGSSLPRMLAEERVAHYHYGSHEGALQNMEGKFPLWDMICGTTYEDWPGQRSVNSKAPATTRKRCPQRLSKSTTKSPRIEITRASARVGLTPDGQVAI